MMRDHSGYVLAGGGGVRAGQAAGRLGAMLRAGACGMHGDEAAVELLVGHGHWAGHGEFAARFAQLPGCPGPGGAPMAWGDWQAAAGGPGGAGPAAPAAEAACVL